MLRTLAAFLALAASAVAADNDEPKVTDVPEAVVKKFKLDTEFYKKHVDYKGFSILSSAKVSDAGLLEARYLIDKLLGDREDILKAMIKRGCRFMVMAPTEMTTAVPEQRHMKNDPKTDWDKRARGLGGRLSSCGEENLLNLKGDRYRQENILIHEFNHAIHQQGLREVDPTFDRRLREAYRAAMDKGLWKGTYVATDPAEYWAEGAQAYFDCMRPQFGANTREKLEKYDEGLFKLVDEVFKQSKFRYVRYDQRKKAEGAPPTGTDPGVTVVNIFPGDTGPGPKDAPDNSGAVGPNHVVDFTNANVVIRRMTQTEFWKGANPEFNFPKLNDPRLLYDPLSGRWFGVIAEFRKLSVGYLAVSQSSDPAKVVEQLCFEGVIGAVRRIAQPGQYTG